jgi:glycosyltransferase involved in cell wall biosynthesis
MAADHVHRGWDVVVACPPEGWLPDDVRARSGADLVPWEATRDPSGRTAKETASVAGVIRAVRPDVMHLHSSKAGLAGRLAARGRVPTVFQPHAWSFHAVSGALRRAAIAWERLGARWCDAIVCVSEGEREEGLEEGIRGRFHVIPNGVRARPPAAPDDRAAARADLRLSGGPVVVCVGRLAPQKGQDVLIGAWARVASRFPIAQLVLVGDGPDRVRLEAAAPERVRFEGWVHDPRPYLRAADVVAIPSLWEGGLTLVAMDAMAEGRPVVATDVAGMRDGLGPDGGAIVPVDDPGALADALLERLEDPARAAREGAAGRERVERLFTLERTLERVASLYDEILAARRRR